MLIRIAIVDDQPEARELLRQDLLVRVPAGTSIACFLTAASPFWSGFVPGDDSLIFLDICMKGMNGIEAAERVQAKRAMPDRAFNLVQRICLMPFRFIRLTIWLPYQTSQLSTCSRRNSADGGTEPQVEIRMPARPCACRTGRFRAIASHGHGSTCSPSPACAPDKLADLRRAGSDAAGDERFLPCNRGVLVNMDEALKLDGDSIILMNGMRSIRQRNRLENGQPFLLNIKSAA